MTIQMPDDGYNITIHTARHTISRFKRTLGFLITHTHTHNQSNPCVDAGLYSHICQKSNPMDNLCNARLLRNGNPDISSLRHAVSDCLDTTSGKHSVESKAWHASALVSHMCSAFGNRHGWNRGVNSYGYLATFLMRVQRTLPQQSSLSRHTSTACSKLLIKEEYTKLQREAATQSYEPTASATSVRQPQRSFHFHHHLQSRYNHPPAPAQQEKTGTPCAP